MAKSKCKGLPIADASESKDSFTKKFGVSIENEIQAIAIGVSSLGLNHSSYFNGLIWYSYLSLALM